MCRQLNQAVIENTQSERFITFFYGVLDSAWRMLSYTNAGHLPPILIRADGSIERLSAGGAVLGVLKNTPYEEGRVTFAPGDHLVLMTDGITEATNLRGEEFGESRLIQVLRENQHRSGFDLQQLVLERIASFAGKVLQDDATMMIISANR
jgi:phosphoserine phosphatase RsbU/P